MPKYLVQIPFVVWVDVEVEQAENEKDAKAQAWAQIDNENDEQLLARKNDDMVDSPFDAVVYNFDHILDSVN